MPPLRCQNPHCKVVKLSDNSMFLSQLKYVKLAVDLKRALFAGNAHGEVEELLRDEQQLSALAVSEQKFLQFAVDDEMRAQGREEEFEKWMAKCTQELHCLLDDMKTLREKCKEIYKARVESAALACIALKPGSWKASLRTDSISLPAMVAAAQKTLLNTTYVAGLKTGSGTLNKATDMEGKRMSPPNQGLTCYVNETEFWGGVGWKIGLMVSMLRTPLPWSFCQPSPSMASLG